jgi:hypothetical protein
MVPFYLEARTTGANRKPGCNKILFHDLHVSVSAILKERKPNYSVSPQGLAVSFLRPFSSHMINPYLPAFQ